MGLEEKVGTGFVSELDESFSYLNRKAAEKWESVTGKGRRVLQRIYHAGSAALPLAASMLNPSDAAWLQLLSLSAAAYWYSNEKRNRDDSKNEQEEDHWDLLSRRGWRVFGYTVGTLAVVSGAMLAVSGTQEGYLQGLTAMSMGASSLLYTSAGYLQNT